MTIYEVEDNIYVGNHAQIREAEARKGLEENKQTQVREQPELLIKVPPIPISWYSSIIPRIESLEAERPS